MISAWKKRGSLLLLGALFLFDVLGSIANALEQGESAEKPTAVVEGGKNSQSTAVTVQANRREIRIGEPLEMTIQVRDQKKASFRLPAHILLSPFVELERSEKTAEDGAQTFHLKIATYEKTGELKVPAFSLEPLVQAPQDAEKPPEVPSLDVKVQSILNGLENPTPRGAAPPVRVYVTDRRPLVFIVIALCWMAMVAGLRWLRPLREADTRLLDLPPPRLAHEIALEKLQRLVEEDLLRSGRFKEYFFRISEAVREYIGNRYGFFALDLTTRELTQELRDRLTPGLENASLREMLEHADMVKFAQLQPTDDMCSQAFNGAYALIEATKMAPQMQEKA
jgi:hypothetical protein